MNLQGTSLDELRDALAILDQNLKIDLIPGYNQFFIRMNPKKEWELVGKPQSSGGSSGTKGRGYQTLMRTLEGLDQEGYVSGLTVLVIAKTAMTRHPDGSFDTIWYQFDPTEEARPVTMKFDGDEGIARISYPVIRLRLSEAEYGLCQTGIALFDEVTGILYPIQESALHAVGALLKCKHAFLSETPPVAAGMILASKLGSANGLKMVSRKFSETIRPIIGLVGSAYQVASQQKFFGRLIDRFDAGFPMGTTLESWNIKEEATTVTFLVHALHPDYDLEVEAIASDMAEQSYEVNLYARLYHEEQFGKIFLAGNKLSHRYDMDAEENLSKLLAGIFPAAKKFATEYDRLPETVMLRPKMVQKIFTILGKKRCEDLPCGGSFSVLELFSVYWNTGRDLNKRWKKELAEALGDLFHQLVNKGGQ